MMGFGNGVAALSAIILTSLAGILCAINWHYTVGVFIVGLAFVFMISAINVELATFVPPFGLSIAAGLLMALINVGAFCVPFYLVLLENIFGPVMTLRLPFVISYIILLIGTIVMFFARRKAPSVPVSPGV